MAIESTSSEFKKCIICQNRIEFSDKINLWNEKCVDYLQTVIFKYKKAATMSDILSNMSHYCNVCVESVSDVDLTLSKIRELKIKLKDLTNKLMNDNSGVNFNPSESTPSYNKGCSGLGELFIDETANKIVNARGNIELKTSGILDALLSQEQQGKTTKDKIKYNCLHSNCTRTFMTKNGMTRHMKNFHSLKYYSQMCPICSKGFDTSKDLETHSIIHQGENPFNCEDCSKVFSNSCHLSNHVKQIHQNSKRESCSICSQSFPSLEYLRVHQRNTHMLYGPLKCNICEEEFPKKSELIRHRATHFPNKVRKCYFCNKSFKSASALSPHIIRIHLGEKPYKCKLCHKHFSQAPLLQKHEKLDHSGIKMSCFRRRTTINNRHELINHKIVEHENAFQLYPIDYSIKTKLLPTTQNQN